MVEENGGKRAAAWLSEGVETLFATLDEQVPVIDFDVLIVGSGYGGAVAAAGLAGSRDKGKLVKVGVLERGKEYLPGSFPGHLRDLAGHVRFNTPNGAVPVGNREGLFDVRVGPDVSALVANGLGGGSLINAGVMVAPRGAALKKLSALVDGLEPYFAKALEVLGARVNGAPNTILQHAGDLPAKYVALQKMAARLHPADGVCRHHRHAGQGQRWRRGARCLCHVRGLRHGLQPERQGVARYQPVVPGCQAGRQDIYGGDGAAHRA